MNLFLTIERLMNRFHRLEAWFLGVSLLAMLGMSVLQIVLRNIFGTGIAWGDVLVRILVLWTGLIGGMVASRTGEHIRIDWLVRYFPEALGMIVRRIIHLLTAAICGVIAYYSFQFVQSEKAFGDMAFANVPAWVCAGILPVVFGVMTVRHLTRVFRNDPSENRDI